MEVNDVLKFVDFCKKEFDFSNLETPYRYQSLSICLIDCIYSLRTRYFSTTVPLVKRYADQYTNGNIYDAKDNLRDLMNHIDEAGGCEEFATNILKNRQQLNGRIKSEICYELADKMTRLLGINTLDDFRDYKDLEMLDIVLRSVKGFGDAGLNYLYMLAGDPDKCKPDVHILRCVKDVTGKTFSNDECQELFTKTVEELKKDYPDLTVRELDSLIWEKYQIGNK